MPGPVLHRAADAAGDVELGAHRRAGLADLVVVLDQAGVDRRPGRPDLAADGLGQFVNQREVLLAAHAVAAGDDDPCALQVAGLGFLGALDDLHHQCPRR